MIASSLWRKMTGIKRNDCRTKREWTENTFAFIRYKWTSYFSKTLSMQMRDNEKGIYLFIYVYIMPNAYLNSLWVDSSRVVPFRFVSIRIDSKFTIQINLVFCSDPDRFVCHFFSISVSLSILRIEEKKSHCETEKMFFKILFFSLASFHFVLLWLPFPN